MEYVNFLYITNPLCFIIQAPYVVWSNLRQVIWQDPFWTSQNLTHRTFFTHSQSTNYRFLCYLLFHGTSIFGSCLRLLVPRIFLLNVNSRFNLNVLKLAVCWNILQWCVHLSSGQSWRSIKKFLREGDASRSQQFVEWNEEWK